MTCIFYGRLGFTSHFQARGFLQRSADPSIDRSSTGTQGADAVIVSTLAAQRQTKNLLCYCREIYYGIAHGMLSNLLINNKFFGDRRSNSEALMALSS